MATKPLCFGELSLTAYTGTYEATQRDLAALMKLWSDFVPWPPPPPKAFPKAAGAPAPAAPASAALRCLEATHDATCTKCAPPATCGHAAAASRLP